MPSKQLALSKKLAFSTLGCVDLSLKEQLKLAHKFGIRALEIRGVQGVLAPEEVADFQPQNWPKTEALLAQYDCRLIGLGSSANFHDAQTLEAKKAEAQRAIRVAAACQIPYVRVFGNNLPPASQPKEREACIQQVASALSGLADLAAEQGVELLLEVHGDFNSCETLGPLLSLVGQRQGFGLIWDVAHSDRACGDHWQAFFELIWPWVRHIHLKDHHRGQNLPDAKPDAPTETRLCLPGEGDIPLKAIVEETLRQGYEGYYSLEWEKQWHPELPPLEQALEAYVQLMATCE